jgi:gluconokinase
MSKQPQAIILMGVSGCGKTSVGQRLSRVLCWPFFDGDDFHPEENVDKMAAGIPLNDDDRIPWLATLHDLIADHLSDGQSMLLACSALKQKYRDQLVEGNPGTVFVHLKGDFNLIYERMQTRAGHYMKPEMLHSQFRALEEPDAAITVSAKQRIEQITSDIIRELELDLMVE